MMIMITIMKIIRITITITINDGNDNDGDNDYTHYDNPINTNCYYEKRIWIMDIIINNLILHTKYIFLKFRPLCTVINKSKTQFKMSNKIDNKQMTYIGISEQQLLQKLQILHRKRECFLLTIQPLILRRID